jgi:hypothetical protein
MHNESTSCLCDFGEFFFLCHNKKETNGVFTSSHYYYCPLKICIDETLPNLIKGKHPRKGEKKRGGGAKDQSPGKQTAQKRFVLSSIYSRVSYLLGTQIELFWGKWRHIYVYWLLLIVAICLGCSPLWLQRMKERKSSHKLLFVHKQVSFTIHYPLNFFL